MENTNKILNSFNLKKIARLENLSRVPILEVGRNANYIMSAINRQTTRGFLFERTIVATESLYRIEVNYRALSSIQKRYTVMFGSMQAGRDITYGLLLHEFRHCWQAQTGFKVGHKEDTLDMTNAFDGHGELHEELDANGYMIEHALTNKQKTLFEFFKIEQSCGGISKMFNSEFNKELRNKALECAKFYNPVWGWILKLL